MLREEMDDKEDERKNRARMRVIPRECMRWHVHGTDVATGQPVTLAVDDMLATDAVQAALSKRIIVSHVTRASLRRALFPLACAIVVVLIPVCAGMYWYQDRMLHQLQLLQKEQAHLTAELTESETNVRDLKAAGASLVDYRAVAAANEQVKSLAQQLAAARTQLADDQKLAARLETTDQALAASRRQLTQLELEAKEQVQNATVATAAQAQVRIDAAEKTNRELAGQIETFKGQLLVTAANSVAGPPAKSEDDSEPAPSSPMITRWGLRTGYDVTSDFVALHFDKESMQVQPQGDGTVLWDAVSPANAAAMRVVYNKDRRRVYSVSLTVSLAPDAPKAKLEENMGLVAQMLKVFAPGLKDAGGRVSRAASELANKDGSERMVLVGQDAKVTVWNNGTGAFTWRVESLGNEAGG